MIKEYIKSKVIEISDYFVSLNCLIDEQDKIIEIRDFEFNIFKEMNLKLNDFIDIKIIVDNGYTQINFKKSNNDYSELFKKEDLFSKFKNSSIFKPLSQDTNNDF